MKALLLFSAMLCLCAAAAPTTKGARDDGPESLVQQFLAQPDLELSYRMLKAWKDRPAPGKGAILDDLVKHLAAVEASVPTNTFGVLITCRPETKEHFGGMGLVIRQDVYIAGGKAAWGIETMLGGNVSAPQIKEKMSDEQRKEAVLGTEMLVRAYKKGVQDALKAATRPGAE